MPTNNTARKQVTNSLVRPEGVQTNVTAEQKALEKLARQFYDAKILADQAKEVREELKTAYLSLSPPRDVHFTDANGILRRLQKVDAESLELTASCDEFKELLGSHYEDCIEEVPKVAKKDRDGKKFGKEGWLGFAKSAPRLKGTYHLKPSVSLKIQNPVKE